MKLKTVVKYVVLIYAGLFFWLINLPAEATVTKTTQCNICHGLDAGTSISLSISQSQTAMSYSVSGSNNYNSKEGWAVFDYANNNITNGMGSGSFEVPRDGASYRVFWVDDADNDSTAPDSGKGGIAFVDIVADWDITADFNNDGEVNLLDFSELAAAWMSSTGDANFKDIYDLSPDGTIDMNDLVIFAEFWLL